ncbi:MAG TPA: hypothetical protein VKR30_01080 [Candidatus Limnocylindrales bacterium]|nr:hypothetical protein [Candidatus Limnocylindrales bacterium]
MTNATIPEPAESVAATLSSIMDAHQRRRLLAGSKVLASQHEPGFAGVDLEYAGQQVRVLLLLERFAIGDRVSIEVLIRPRSGLGRLLGWRTVIRRSQLGARTFPDVGTMCDEITFRVGGRPEVRAYTSDARKNIWWPRPS